MADILFKMQLRRVFAAIDLSETARAAAADYGVGLRQKFPDTRARWELPEKYHITLRFEAAADEEMLAELERLIKEASRITSPFDLELYGTGAFENRRGPAVLWLGLQAPAGGDPLLALARKLANTERRRFSPHLTLARIRDASKARLLIDTHLANPFPAQRFTVAQLKLYESTLSSSGSTYSVLLSEELKG